MLQGYYQQKYLKYKTKYLGLKNKFKSSLNLEGGSIANTDSIYFDLDNIRQNNIRQNNSDNKVVFNKTLLGNTIIYAGNTYTIIRFNDDFITLSGDIIMSKEYLINYIMGNTITTIKDIDIIVHQILVNNSNKMNVSSNVGVSNSSKSGSASSARNVSVNISPPVSSVFNSNSSSSSNTGAGGGGRNSKPVLDNPDNIRASYGTKSSDLPLRTNSGQDILVYQTNMIEILRHCYTKNSEIAAKDQTKYLPNYYGFFKQVIPFLNFNKNWDELARELHSNEDYNTKNLSIEEFKKELKMSNELQQKYIKSNIKDHLDSISSFIDNDENFTNYCETLLKILLNMCYIEVIVLVIDKMIEIKKTIRYNPMAIVINAGVHQWNPEEMLDILDKLEILSVIKDEQDSIEEGLTFRSWITSEIPLPYLDRKVNFITRIHHKLQEVLNNIRNNLTSTNRGIRQLNEEIGKIHRDPNTRKITGDPITPFIHTMNPLDKETIGEQNAVCRENSEIEFFNSLITLLRFYLTKLNKYDINISTIINLEDCPDHHLPVNWIIRNSMDIINQRGALLNVRSELYKSGADINIEGEVMSLMYGESGWKHLMSTTKPLNDLEIERYKQETKNPNPNIDDMYELFRKYNEAI